MLELKKITRKIKIFSELPRKIYKKIKEFMFMRGAAHKSSRHSALQR